MEGKHLELEVRVHGKPVREYQHAGKIFIEGREGSPFVLRVRNRTNRRALAVISVDGLSIMDGEEASFDSSGYVIDPFGFIDIPGWRLNDNEVAKFIFAKAGSSYASKKSKPANVGVIGCACFLEKQIEYQRFMRSCNLGDGAVASNGIPRDPGGSTFCSFAGPEAPASAQWQASVQQAQEVGSEAVADVFASSAPELGTAFGEAASHTVTTTHFERADKPDELLEVQYDSREGLQRRGVDLRQKPSVATPNPFPGQPSGCRPPEGWQR